MGLLAASLRREERSHELGTFLSRVFLSGICSEPDLVCGRRIQLASADQVPFPLWLGACARGPWRARRLVRRIGLQYIFAHGLSSLVRRNGIPADALQQCGR